MSTRHPLEESERDSMTPPPSIERARQGMEKVADKAKAEDGPSSIQQRLERERDHLLRRLAEVTQAIDLLKQRPELETLHRLLRGSLY